MENQNKILINEIQNYLTELDYEDLLFLKEQASVLHYNMEVKKRNSLLKEKSTSSNHEEFNAETPVYIEPIKKGKYFNLCLKKEKIFMDRQEVITLLKIAHAAETPESGALRLFNWFKKERKDVLVDGHISSNKNPLLILIYKELMDNFTID